MFFKRNDGYSFQSNEEFKSIIKERNKEEFKFGKINTFLSLFNYKYIVSEYEEDEHLGNLLVSSSFLEISLFFLLRDDYTKGKSKKIKINDNYKKYDVSKLLEELVRFISEYSLLNDNCFFNKIFHLYLKDFMLYSLYYPNSIHISSSSIFCLNIPIHYYLLFFELSELSFITSFLII